MALMFLLPFFCLLKKRSSEELIYTGFLSCSHRKDKAVSNTLVAATWYFPPGLVSFIGLTVWFQ